jgi:hypothetical protein
MGINFKKRRKENKERDKYVLAPFLVAKTFPNYISIHLPTHPKNFYFHQTKFKKKIFFKKKKN